MLSFFLAGKVFEFLRHKIHPAITRCFRENVVIFLSHKFIEWLNMNYLEPWYAIPNPKHIESQLSSELPRKHILSGIRLTALAQRQDCDDFLFSLHDGTNRVAVVHLTFSRNIDARWSRTELYSSIEIWATEKMHNDHLEFNA